MLEVDQINLSVFSILIWPLSFRWPRLSFLRGPIHLTLISFFQKTNNHSLADLELAIQKSSKEVKLDLLKNLGEKTIYGCEPLIHIMMRLNKDIVEKSSLNPEMLNLKNCNGKKLKSYF